MILKGDIGYLELNILSNKTLGSNDFWEENWLYASVKGNFPGFTANYDCYLRTDDLQSCYHDIMNLIGGTTNNAKFVTLEEGIELFFQKQQSGCVEVSGRLIATELTKCSLKFDFVTDMSVMMDFSLQLQKVLNKYPIIGEPY